VAVARALANGPDVVLADEPSGNLDHAHSENLHAIFAGLARDYSTALVVVTHNRHLAARADRLLSMEAGLLVPGARQEGIA
jgi:predicted ABC-type transport system involved in lysophospholipase L1 biosynthesis ATPase subunit